MRILSAGIKRVSLPNACHFSSQLSILAKLADVACPRSGGLEDVVEDVVVVDLVSRQVLDAFLLAFLVERPGDVRFKSCFIAAFSASAACLRILREYRTSPKPSLSPV